MVMSCDFQQIFDETSIAVVVTLPAYKETVLKLDFQDQKDTETVYKDKEPPLPFARSDIFPADILSWRRLTAADGDCKAVYEVTFDVRDHGFALLEEFLFLLKGKLPCKISAFQFQELGLGVDEPDSNLEFKAGDTVGILPRNKPEEVNAVLEHLGVTTQADLCYNLHVNSNLKGKIPAHIPVKSTIRHVLTYCVDLRSVLKKLLILALSRHTKCDTERRALEYLCSKEGAASYTTHILNKSICLLDIFTIFKTCKPPIEILLANLPRLLPRPYSIVNSGLKDSSILKICFSVMTLENNRQGLTTSWLEMLLQEHDNFESRMQNLSLNSHNRERVPMYVRRNMADFSLPSNIKSHLIMIATGTGVAPFMGFLEEREMMKEPAQSEMGEAWLFFGCRNPGFDYLYEGELGQYEDSMVLNKCITAFSRVKNVEARRVQNALCDNGEDVARLIKEGASVFVCGEAKSMVTQVKESIISYLGKYGGQSEEEAGKYIAQMEKDKRYVVDLWS